MNQGVGRNISKLLSWIDWSRFQYNQLNKFIERDSKDQQLRFPTICLSAADQMEHPLRLTFVCSRIQMF